MKNGWIELGHTHNPNGIKPPKIKDGPIVILTIFLIAFLWLHMQFDR